MDQLIFASLSHTHSWYEVGMLKIPAEIIVLNEKKGKVSAHTTRVVHRVDLLGSANSYILLQMPYALQGREGQGDCRRRPRCHEYRAESSAR